MRDRRSSPTLQTESCAASVTASTTASPSSSSAIPRCLLNKRRRVKNVLLSSSQHDHHSHLHRRLSSSSSSSSSSFSFLRPTLRFSALVALTHLFLLFLFLVPSASGVDRNNFKTCDQSGFCKLQRAVAEGACRYELRLDSLKNDGEGKVVGELVQPEEEKRDEKLYLEIWGLKDNSVRYIIYNISLSASYIH